MRRHPRTGRPRPPPSGVAPLAAKDRGDEVADVADGEQAGQDLAGEVGEAGPDRVVVVRAAPPRRVAAGRALDDLTEAGVVGERVVILAVRVAVAVAVRVERVGPGLELVVVGEPVAVAVGDARVEAVLDLLGVGDSIAVAVGLVRVRPYWGLEVVRDAVLVRVGAERIAAVRALLLVREPVAVAVGGGDVARDDRSRNSSPFSPTPMLSTIAPMPHLIRAPTSVVATAAMITETISSAPRSSAAV